MPGSENSITRKSAVEIAGSFKAGEVSAAEIVDRFVSQINDQSSLNAVLCDAFESATTTARQLDERRAKGETLGPLAGVPVIVKDGICTEGIKTTAASRMLESFIPPYDATVVKKLKAADAMVIAKSNMDEFAMGGSNENSAFGCVRNPWNTGHVPGGSSGGSAAAVAAQMSPIAIGSDTGGSIRQPASFCGITGLKPTYGRVSRLGLIAFASSLDQIGPMAYSAEDVALVCDAITGHDAGDSTSSRMNSTECMSALTGSMSGKTIGMARAQLEGVSPEVVSAIEDAIDVFKGLGAVVQDIEIPSSEFAVAAYYLIAPCEASSNLARYDGVRYGKRAEAASLDEMYAKTRGDGFGQEVKRRIMLGTFALSSGYYDAYYLKASKVRRLIKQDFENTLSQVDMILGPTAPTTAFKVGERIDDPVSMYLADVFTVSANLAGIPALSAPCGFDKEGLPIGLQLQGRPFEEHLLLNAAHQYQLQTDWHQRRPA